MRDAGLAAAGSESRPTRTRSPGLLTAVKLVLAPTWVRVLGVVLALGSVFGYSVLLTFPFTQRLSVANWRYLDAYRMGWAVVLGLALAAVLTLQIGATRRIASRGAGGTVTGVAVLGSLLPSLLCCTPVIPTLLALAGMSTIGVYGTAGALQRFFAVHEIYFMLGSLGLLLVSGWWALRRTATGCGSDGCSIPDPAPQARLGRRVPAGHGE